MGILGLWKDMTWWCAVKALLLRAQKHSALCLIISICSHHLSSLVKDRQPQHRDSAIPRMPSGDHASTIFL